MFETPRQIRSAVVGGGNAAVPLPPPAQLDLGKVGAALWAGRATIILTTIGALFLAAMFIALAPTEYTAVTQILIDPTDLRAVGNEAQPTQMSDAAAMQIESQVNVLTSDAVLRRVVASEGLTHDTEFVREPSLLATLMGRTALPGGRALAALNELKRRVKVTRDPRTLVVEVDVTSRDPYKAVSIANAIAQAYLAEQTQVRADAARQVSQSLSSHLKELKDKVRDSEEKVEDYKARNNLITANGQLVTDQQLTDLNNQLAAARARTADAKGRLDQIEQVQHNKDKADNGAFPAALQSPTIAALRAQYAEVMRREAEQTATLGALHPAVIDIQAQAERLHRMIDAEVDRAAAAARTEYESAKASEQALTDNYAALKQTALDNGAAMVGLRELERDAQASRDIYQAFLVRARETGAQEQVDTKNIRVLSKADLPQKRSSPPPSLLVALGAMMFGAAAGTGIVLVRPAPAGERPRGVGKTWRRTLAALGLWGDGAVGVPVLAVLPATDVSFALEAADDPTSPTTKEMRKVYDELRASHDADGNPTVLVLAADDKDDAATVALSLAAVAATTQRVLLIDADLGRRTLAALDAEEGDAGLVDVAVGRRTLSEAIKVDRDTNIGLMAFVTPASRRDRRVYDGDIARAFAQTKRYDLVIVGAMDEADPSLGFFAGLVDHILLVDDAETFDEAALERFVSRLGLDAGKVRGAVLTGAVPA